MNALFRSRGVPEGGEEETRRILVNQLSARFGRCPLRARAYRIILLGCRRRGGRSIEFHWRRRARPPDSCASRAPRPHLARGGFRARRAAAEAG